MSDSTDEIAMNIDKALKWAQVVGFDLVAGELLEVFDGDFVSALRVALRCITRERLSDEVMAERCMLAVAVKLYEAEGGLL